MIGNLNRKTRNLMPKRASVEKNFFTVKKALATWLCVRSAELTEMLQISLSRRICRKRGGEEKSEQTRAENPAIAFSARSSPLGAPSRADEQTNSPSLKSRRSETRIMRQHGSRLSNGHKKRIFIGIFSGCTNHACTACTPCRCSCPW